MSKKIMAVGIDVGHGKVKSAQVIGGKIVNDIFSSIVAIADRNNPLLNPDSVSREKISFDGHVYFVGDLASQQKESKLIRARNDSDVASPAWKALLRVALAHQALRFRKENGVMPDEVLLASGLPVEFYNNASARDNLDAELANIGKFIMGDSLPFELSVHGACLPQSYSTYLNESMHTGGDFDEKSDIANAGVIGVIDVGEGTTDLAYIENDSYMMDLTGSRIVGMRNAIDSICAQIHQKYSVRIPVNRRDAMLKYSQEKSVYTLISGGRGDVDVTDIAKEHLRELAYQVVDFVRSKWNVDEINNMLLTGGAARHLHPLMLEIGGNEFSHLTLAKDGVFANVNGYLKYAVAAAAVDVSPNEELKKAA